MQTSCLSLEPLNYLFLALLKMVVQTDLRKFKKI